ncbi:hypothetical protein [Novosphingobium sp. B-7]|uniref:hypothetical protein n=1 Tax=Novosphingobium sp. B-7 TaxID=1298855 RepID=UPI00130D7C2C|nr:hypothetical protein [Novosphingobium sp. B-7]
MNNLANAHNFSAKSRSAIKAVHKTLLITTAIGFYVPSALAQVAVGLPKNLDSDDNGISYSSGLPVISEKILSIGGSQNGLEHIRTITGNRNWIHN